MTRHLRSTANAGSTAFGLIAAVAVTAVIAGCGSDDGASAPSASGSLGDLANQAYLSTQVTQDGQDRPLVDGTAISLRFWDSRLSAQAGCNTLGGDATLRDNVIDIAGGLSMTEMGCAGPLMRQDGWLADMLGSRPVATLDGDRLTLTSGDTVVEFLNEEAANPDRPLTGTTWTLESYGGTAADDSVSSLPSDVESTLSIDDTGRVSIQPGCNTGGGQATVGDTSIEFGSIALTRMACPETQTGVENFVVGVLDGSVAYVVDGDTLTLTNDGSSLTYRAR
jgi:heat shock protein HslJ